MNTLKEKNFARGVGVWRILSDKILEEKVQLTGITGYCVLAPFFISATNDIQKIIDKLYKPNTTPETTPETTSQIAPDPTPDTMAETTPDIPADTTLDTASDTTL